VASVRHVTRAKATNVACAKTSDATPAEAADVASAKAANVAATAAHMAAATTTVSSATAAAGLRSRGKKAAGKHRTCQNHHHSSSHYTLHWDGRTSAACWTWARLRKGNQRRDRVEMGFLACRLH
jgi:septal ring-binding cell division protein DamX